MGDSSPTPAVSQGEGATGPQRGPSVSCANKPLRRPCSGNNQSGVPRDEWPPLPPTRTGPVPHLVSRAVLTVHGPTAIAHSPSGMNNEASGTFCSSRIMRPSTMFRHFSAQIPWVVMTFHFHGVYVCPLSCPNQTSHTHNKQKMQCFIVNIAIESHGARTGHLFPGLTAEMHQRQEADYRPSKNAVILKSLHPNNTLREKRML